LISRTGLRVALVAAGVAALIVLLNLFSVGFRIVCLGVIVVAAALAAPVRRISGGGWWWLLAVGAGASVLGAIIAQPAASLGGWLALIGGLVVMIATAIGFPREEEE
jgi:hypothetical protein